SMSRPQLVADRTPNADHRVGPSRSRRRHSPSAGRSQALRWACLGLAWVLIAVIAALDTFAEREYVDMLGASGTLSTDVLPLRRSSPYQDTYTWTRYALALQEGSERRLRHTDIDNAPAGRDVHWNSAFAHLVADAGRIRHAFTGEPLETA